MYITTNRTSQVFNDLHEEGINCHINENGSIILDTDTKLQHFISYLADYNSSVQIDFNFINSKVRMTFTS